MHPEHGLREQRNIKRRKSISRQEPGDNLQDKYFVPYNKMKNLRETQCFAMQDAKPWGSVYKIIP